MLDVTLDRQPERFLNKAERTLAGRFAEKIEELRKNPIPSDARRISGSALWRVRVGDYRILYYVRYERQTVFIAKIDHRSRVYDNLT